MQFPFQSSYKKQPRHLSAIPAYTANIYRYHNILQITFCH